MNPHRVKLISHRITKAKLKYTLQPRNRLECKTHRDTLISYRVVRNSVTHSKWTGFSGCSMVRLQIAHNSQYCLDSHQSCTWTSSATTMAVLTHFNDHPWKGTIRIRIVYNQRITKPARPSSCNRYSPWALRQRSPFNTDECAEKRWRENLVRFDLNAMSQQCERPSDERRQCIGNAYSSSWATYRIFSISMLIRVILEISYIRSFLKESD